MPPNQIEGNVASFEGVPSAEAILLMVNLDTLSANILRTLGELKQQGREVAPQVHQKLKKSLKVKEFLQVSIPEEVPVAPLSSTADPQDSA
jgi:hypothetical protein